MNEPAGAEVVDGEPADLPREELAEAVTDALSAEAMVVSTAERHDGFVAMDAHDAARLIDRITRQAQEGHLAKRWVYDLPYGGGRGLTVDAVEDVTQLMNWSGYCAIGIVPETLKVELIEGDEDGDPAKFWVADIAARDDKTGVSLMGSAMEPQRMKLKADTAKKKRSQGKPIPDDDRVFDRFARTKAINKAERNAKEKFIPEVVKLHLLAMAAKNPSIVERIETPEEAKLRELPPPLDTPEAKALLEECAAIYDEIRGLGGGRGAVALTPGRYHGMLVSSQHDLVLLRSGRDWLLERREQLRAHFETEGGS
jgi:hypothetical protein